MAWAALVDDHHASHDDLAAVMNEPWAPLRATWGTDPDAARGHKAMMELAGGPAPRRAPKPTDEGAAS